MTYSSSCNAGATSKQYHRTLEDVEKTRKELAHECRTTSLLWIAIVAVLLTFMGAAKVWTIFPAMLFIATFIAVKGYTDYRASKMANELTLGVLCHAADEDNRSSSTVEMIKKLCKRFDIQEPEHISYNGEFFRGKYDPVASTLTMGKYFENFENDASYAFGLHECCRHILVNNPANKDKRKKQLEAAVMMKVAAVFMAALCVLNLLFAPEAIETQTLFSISLILILVSKACTTTHEYEVNSFVCQLLFDNESPKVLDRIENRNQVFMLLKAEELIYTVDLIGWIGIVMLMYFALPVLF